MKHFSKIFFHNASFLICKPFLFTNQIWHNGYICSKTTWEGSGKPMKDHVSFQERLKDLRVEKGLKLEELAEKTGISKSALASYENEENGNKEINHGNLITLADFYQVSIDYLFCRTEN